MPVISMGDLLRRRAVDNTQRSGELGAMLDRGDLVPDDLVLAVVRDHVRATEGQGYVLDGFPRTVAQARSDAAPVDVVVDLALPDDVARERLPGARREAEPTTPVSMRSSAGSAGTTPTPSR